MKKRLESTTKKQTSQEHTDYKLTATTLKYKALSENSISDININFQTSQETKFPTQLCMAHCAAKPVVLQIR